MPPKRLLPVLLASAAAVLCCAALLLSSRPERPGKTAAPQQAQAAAPADDGQTLLFPEFDQKAVTAISIDAPDTRFDFLCTQPGSVSVNGQRADDEVFRTLIAQIAEMTVSPAAHMPEDSELLMNLTVLAGGTQLQAAFYAGGSDASRTFVRTGGADAPRYHQTAGWRVGTMMLTCEGTRIQDERGNESPAP